MPSDRVGSEVLQYCPPHDYQLVEDVGEWKIRRCTKCGEKDSRPVSRGVDG